MPEMTATDVVDFANKWVEALTSGDHEQARSCLVMEARVGLQNKRAYCCLGVGACVVEGLPTKGYDHTDTPEALLVFMPGDDMTPDEDGFYQNGEENFPPVVSKTHQVIEALGMEPSTLSDLNDTQERSFMFIGGYIAAHLATYAAEHAEELSA